MNNIEKKLDALIDALGFDVERINNKTYGKTIQAGFFGASADDSKAEFEFFPATKDMKQAEYREVIRSNDYKLTKRNQKTTEAEGALKHVKNLIFIRDNLIKYHGENAHYDYTHKINNAISFIEELTSEKI